MSADMFLKLDGITGESKDKKHTNEIEVQAMTWGMVQTGTGGSGGGSGTGKVAIQDITISKYVDSASADLLLKCANGTHIAKGVFVARKAGGENPLEYLKVTMNEVLIASVSHSGSSGGELMSETVSLNFAKVEVEYFEQDDKGIGTPKGSMTWDVKANAK